MINRGRGAQQCVVHGDWKEDSRSPRVAIEAIGSHVYPLADAKDRTIQVARQERPASH